MSSEENAINVKDISKLYAMYRAPQDRLKQAVLPRLLGLFGIKNRRYYDEFWALKNISLTVKKGETIGIIGKNGSGKSTLLQIICGTLTPSDGHVEIIGRVAALLELGAGFNPEFTGRENVYLNAQLFGLNREDVDARFQSIAAFADIGEFMEHPVKTYSSGMYVRLAFAVIAHVDADILIVDEALAVGDAAFIQKCMRFFRRFMETGTVVFVSHDMASVVNLCDRAIWLSNGAIAMKGDAKAVTQSYLRSTLQEVYGEHVELQAIEAPPCKEARGTDHDTKVHFFDNYHSANGWRTGKATIDSIDILTKDGTKAAVFSGGETVWIIIRARALDTIVGPIIGWFLKDRLGQPLFGEHTLSCNATESKNLIMHAGDVVEAQYSFVLPLLANGDYSIDVAFAEGDLKENIQHERLHDAVIVKVSSEKVRYGLVGIPFLSVSVRMLSPGKDASFEQ